MKIHTSSINSNVFQRLYIGIRSSNKSAVIFVCFTYRFVSLYKLESMCVGKWRSSRIKEMHLSIPTYLTSGECFEYIERYCFMVLEVDVVARCQFGK